MPEKDPTTYPLITYAWVLLLSSWGGVVSWLRKRKRGIARPFNVIELIGEIMTSAFAGMLTFWLCEASGISRHLSVPLVEYFDQIGLTQRDAVGRHFRRDPRKVFEG